MIDCEILILVYLAPTNTLQLHISWLTR